MKRVLFFAEGATLAHVARPLLLAQRLDPSRYEVIFARPEAYRWLTANVPFRLETLPCQDSTTFTDRLDRGQPLYDLPTLEDYVETDLTLIDRWRPDLVVGDFRLSLSVSARLRKVPYITICDAYWSPEYPLRPMLPVMRFTPYVPLGIAEPVFRALAPLAFRLHARPMEALRRRFGLKSLGHDLRLCYTDADLRLFANFPELFPEVCRSANADFIGPIAWSPPDIPDLELPEGDGPLVYVTMGSSGDPRVLATLIPLLEAAGARCMVASAGQPLPPSLSSPRTYIHTFLPGDQLCRLAQLVVCNGGSPTTNQALKHGVPVLGIARNMDQFLNMRAITAYGAGLSLRADRQDRTTLERAVTQLLHDARFVEHARRLSCSKMRVDVVERSIDTLVV